MQDRNVSKKRISFFYAFYLGNTIGLGLSVQTAEQQLDFQSIQQDIHNSLRLIKWRIQINFHELKKDFALRILSLQPTQRCLLSSQIQATSDFARSVDTLLAYHTPIEADNIYKNIYDSLARNAYVNVGINNNPFGPSAPLAALLYESTKRTEAELNQLIVALLRKGALLPLETLYKINNIEFIDATVLAQLLPKITHYDKEPQLKNLLPFCTTIVDQAPPVNVKILLDFIKQNFNEELKQNLSILAKHADNRKTSAEQDRLTQNIKQAQEVCSMIQQLNSNK